MNFKLLLLLAILPAAFSQASGEDDNGDGNNDSSESTTRDTTVADEEDETTTTTLMITTEEMRTTITDRIRPERDEVPCEDTVNNRTGRSDCPRSKHLCRRRRYVQFMKEMCPFSCGYCNQTRGNEPKCDDSYPMCNRYRSLCSNARSGPFIQTHCRKTCGLCSGNSTAPISSRPSGNSQNVPVCRDAAQTVFNGRRCHQMLSRCDEESMRRDCARTCGYCIQMEPRQCRDRALDRNGRSTCRKERCQTGNADLITYMNDVCPVTCGLCDAGSGMFF